MNGWAGSQGAGRYTSYCGQTCAARSKTIRKELTSSEHPEVQIQILQATVGGITEADVHLRTPPTR